MKTDKGFVDRRRHKRYAPDEGTLAVVFATIAQVVDISRAGLAFHCVSWDDLQSNHNRLDILFEGSEWLKDIRFSVISRRSIKDRSTSDRLHVQRYGIQFMGLDADQKDQLDRFLLCHTRGESREIFLFSEKNI
jgi:c-di-GMP-binding flagellar brake protein YcgR